MILFSRGSAGTSFSPAEIKDALFSSLDKLGRRNRVLAIPPDFTRFHSQAGRIAELVWNYYGQRLVDVLPALGTHSPMSGEQIKSMYGSIPSDLFRVHDWRSGLTLLGTVPATFISEVSEGKLDYSIPIQVDRLVTEGSHDLILSIGQVVPHEVIGMAGYNKNIFVGIGGAEVINRTHFLGAVYGMERMMGRIDTPVRRVLNYGSARFAAHLPIVYILTVVETDRSGTPVIRGLFIGDGQECFEQAAELSLKVNLQLLDEPLSKIVVYLDPREFRTTWLANKSIYRTRMALADGGELVVLAPGVGGFGEDETIDALIRRFGYAGTPRILELARTDEDLRRNLGAAAHLIHGSSEGRFTITYCPGHLTRREIEDAGFRYAPLDRMAARYEDLVDGFNELPDGEKVFFISNPALGLWACRRRFEP